MVTFLPRLLLLNLKCHRYWHWFHQHAASSCTHVEHVPRVVLLWHLEQMTLILELLGTLELKNQLGVVGYLRNTFLL